MSLRPFSELFDIINNTKFKGIIHVKYDYSSSESYIKPISIKKYKSFHNLNEVKYAYSYSISLGKHVLAYVNNTCSIADNTPAEIVKEIPQKFLLKCLSSTAKELERIKAENETRKEVIKGLNRAWSRMSIVTNDIVGHTFSIFTGCRFVPLKVTKKMIGKRLIDCLDKKLHD